MKVQGLAADNESLQATADLSRPGCHVRPVSSNVYADVCRTLMRVCRTLIRVRRARQVQQLAADNEALQTKFEAARQALASQMGGGKPLHPYIYIYIYIYIYR